MKHQDERNNPSTTKEDQKRTNQPNQPHQQRTGQPGHHNNPDMNPNKSRDTKNPNPKRPG